MFQWPKPSFVGLVAVLVFQGGAAFASSLEREPVGLGTGASTELTLNERARLMADVERVRAMHREGGAAGFDQRYPREMWRDRAMEVVQKSNLLDRRFGVAVDDSELNDELVRICRSTRDPARLREIFAALDNDTFLIKEVLVRPVLVQRYFQNAISWGGEIQSAVRNEAAQLRAKVTLANFEEIAGERLRKFGYRNLRDISEEPIGHDAIGVSSMEFAEILESAGEVGRIYGPNEVREGISIGVTVAKSERSIERMTLWIPKVAPESWWVEQRSAFEPDLPENLVATDSELPTIADAIGKHGLSSAFEKEAGEGVGRWEQKMPPEGGRGSTAVWTGSEMIVWGGKLQEYHNSGGVFDPVTDTWKPVAFEGAPSPRSNHTAVWTGEVMVVWGGNYVPPDDPFPPSIYLSSGGRYDPVSDSWTPTSLENVTHRRSNHTAVWTGEEMIVWGGDGDVLPLTKCGRYNPATDTWLSSISDAPITGNVRHHTAVWTGEEMIVWGGYVPSPGSYSFRGAGYDPSTDSWDLLPSSGLTGRKGHAAVWTGEEMIVWGGERYDGDWIAENSGARFDPAENSWSPVSTEGAPTGRSFHSAVWTGDGMVVWGGDGRDGSSDWINTGAVYDPETDSWAGMTDDGAPSPRMEHPAVWTGTEMIVWGGYPTTSTGGRYDPDLDLWAPTAAGDVSDRENHTAVWTGNEMIVWGGRRYSGVSIYFGSGGIYDPVLDAWRHLPIVDAPSAREEHSAVWGDGVMVVWGGVQGSFISSPYLATGGRYDPVTDAWTATSLEDAPNARIYQSAVWTGEGMLIWGGWVGYGVRTDTGAIYDPATDTWDPMTTDSAPAPRYKPTAVWTGSEAIIWGGNTGEALNIGGRYSPTTDSWSPVAIASSPEPRAYHTAVWTGEEMLVWGGSYWPIPVGARYDPVADEWSSMSEVNAPSARIWHTAVWTGDHMIIWGGQDELSSIVNTGFLYDPESDSWLQTTSQNAPAERAIHTAVWSGSNMLVWGGIQGTSLGIFYFESLIFQDGFESGDTQAWETGPIF